MLCCRAGSLWHLEGLWCLRVEGHAVQEWLKNRLLDPVEEGNVIVSAWGATHLMTASNRRCVGCVGGWKDIIVWQVSGCVEVLIHGTYFCGFSIVTVLNGSYNPDQCCSGYKKSMWYLYKLCFFFFFWQWFFENALNSLVNIISSVIWGRVVWLWAIWLYINLWHEQEVLFSSFARLVQADTLPVFSLVTRYHLYRGKVASVWNFAVVRLNTWRFTFTPACCHGIVYVVSKKRF
jgi:hypothetical protein